MSIVEMVPREAPGKPTEFTLSKQESLDGWVGLCVYLYVCMHGMV